MEEKQAVHILLEDSLESLWLQLQSNIKLYRSLTEEKRRIYTDLLNRDKRGVAEVQDNNKKISKLLVRTF